MDTYESAHHVSISKLVEEFGTEYEKKITGLYNKERTIFEEDSTIRDYIPILTYKIVKNILKFDLNQEHQERIIRKYNKMIDAER